MNEQWINSTGRPKAAWLCAAVALSVTVVAAVGCVAPAVNNTAPRVAPSFDYTPAQQAEPASANITFAVVGTEFATQTALELGGSRAAAQIPLFENFSSSMTGDFAEILTARGYSIRGPFRTYDEIPFPDKEGSNLVLQARVEFASDTSQLVAAGTARSAAGRVAGTVAGAVVPIVGVARALGRVATGGGPSVGSRVEGTVRVEARVTLIVSESVTRETMWTKSVEIEPINVSIEGTQVYPVEPDLTMVLENENQFYTDLGKALEGLYEEIMERTHLYLDPREMALVDKQADGLRELKRY